jgi:hypothetical protein
MIKIDKDYSTITFFPYEQEKKCRKNPKQTGCLLGLGIAFAFGIKV